MSPIFKKAGGKYGIRNVNATYASLGQAQQALRAIQAGKRKKMKGKKDKYGY